MITVIDSEVRPYESWAEWRSKQPAAGKRPKGAIRARTMVREPAWAPCPRCWGQRRILVPVKRPNGEVVGYADHPCGGCLGTGETLS